MLAVFEVNAREAPPCRIWTAVRPDRASDTIPPPRPRFLDVFNIEQPSGADGEVMNMTSDPHSRQRASTFRPLSHITAQMTGVQSEETSVDRQALLWSAYTAADKCAQQTGSQDDIELVREAWLEFMIAYLPNPNDRSSLPMPVLLRSAKQQARQ
jgi:hypothetical protein